MEMPKHIYIGVTALNHTAMRRPLTADQKDEEDLMPYSILLCGDVDELEEPQADVFTLREN